MSKKITVLAMALGVVAAMALPASASAAWKHTNHVTPIAQNVQLGLTSTTNVAFQSHAGGGGLNCQVTSTVDFTAGTTTGLITTFKPHPTSDTTNCKGEGLLAGCQVHNLTPTGLAPHGTGWVIHTTGTAAAPTIQITSGAIDSQITGAFCPGGTVQVTPGTVTATPTPASGITVTGVTLSGTIPVHGSAIPADPAATVKGVLSVESPNSGTYSI